jgi:hypothetical protein
MIQHGTKPGLCVYRESDWVCRCAICGRGFPRSLLDPANAKPDKPRVSGGRIMTHANYLRRQAETLVHLSRATIDLGIAGRLRALAVEFRAKATELENASADYAPLTFGGGVVGAENLERA